MIRAMIFDFNGVIADDETPHLRCFQQALSEHGLSLTKEEYYGTYLGMDERTCATLLITARDHTCDRIVLSAIMDRKATLFREYTAIHKPSLFPGVVEFVTRATTDFLVAIASGGRREQIDEALHGTPIEQSFAIIVSADDCAIGKPDPAIYRHTLKLLNEQEPRPPLVRAEECLVVEDSLAGIQSAQAAGMIVLALSTTYPAEKLGEADHILPNLEGITPEAVLHAMAANRPPKPHRPNPSR